MLQARRLPATAMGRALRVSRETTEAAGGSGNGTQRVTSRRGSRGPCPGVPAVMSGPAARLRRRSACRSVGRGSSAGQSPRSGSQHAPLAFVLPRHHRGLLPFLSGRGMAHPTRATCTARGLALRGRGLTCGTRRLVTSSYTRRYYSSSRTEVLRFALLYKKERLRGLPSGRPPAKAGARSGGSGRGGSETRH